MPATAAHRRAASLTVLAALTAAALVRAAACAAPATRYAGPTGTASGSCLLPKAPCSLRHAVEAVAETGDTVSVASGTDDLNVELDVHADAADFA